MAHQPTSTEAHSTAGAPATKVQLTVNAGEPLPVPDSLRRTFERLVQKWKLQHDVDQPRSHFPQVHHAGDVIAFDFVDLTACKSQ
jgi:hypothetical protein